MKKKKTHLGPKRRVWRRLGPFCLHGPALAFVSRHCLLWAFVGLRWLLWAFVDLCWPLLAAVGFRGPVLSFGGRRWLLWAFVVNKMEEEKNEKKHTYSPNDASGIVWALFVFVGLRWPSLAVIGCCGPLWTCVGL